MNSILAFVGSGLMARILTMVRWTGAQGQAVTLKGWLYEGLLACWLPARVASLAWALLFTAFWLCIAWALFRKRIFIKI